MERFFNYLTLYRLRWKSWLAQERYLLDPTTGNMLAADMWIHKESWFAMKIDGRFHFHNPREEPGAP